MSQIYGNQYTWCRTVLKTEVFQLNIVIRLLTAASVVISTPLSLKV